MIPITKPSLGKDEIDAVIRVMKSGWVAQGPEVETFEKEFKDFTSAKYAVAVSNCTAALHIALKAVGVKKSDEVITVSYSYIATANSIRYCGAIPVFVDIEPETYNIDPNLVEEAISNKTKAILCVHQMGMPCDLKEIMGIANKYNLPVVEDAACSLGSEIKIGKNWEKIGKPHGDIACFSFHPRKIITSGEGGMITTNNGKFDRILRLLRQHGMSKNDSARHNSENVIFEEYKLLGYNFRLTDLQAAIALVQLKRLKSIIKKRRFLASKYFDLFKTCNLISLPKEPNWAKSNWQSFCIRLDQKVNQRDVMQYLLDCQISTRKGIMCAHLEPAYENWHTENDKQDYSKLQYSETCTKTSIQLPLFHELKENEQYYITEKIKAYIERI